MVRLTQLLPLRLKFSGWRSESSIWKFQSGTTLATTSSCWPSTCAWSWWRWRISPEVGSTDSERISSLYYKHITIVDDDSSVVIKWSSKLIDAARRIIYDCHMLIVQATNLSWLTFHYIGCVIINELAQRMGGYLYSSPYMLCLTKTIDLVITLYSWLLNNTMKYLNLEHFV